MAHDPNSQVSQGPDSSELRAIFRFAPTEIKHACEGGIGLRPVPSRYGLSRKRGDFRIVLVPANSRHDRHS